MAPEEYKNYLDAKNFLATIGDRDTPLFNAVGGALKEYTTQKARIITAEIQEKQMILSAVQTMTAREAMARSMKAAIENARDKNRAGGSGYIEPDTLGGNEGKLGD